MPVRSSLRAAAALVALLVWLPAAGCGTGGDDTSQAAEPPGVRPQQRDVTFQSGPDSLHGTFALPPGGGDGLPAALIISGSGPTDRDGDNPGRPDAGTNRNFARVLAEAGVASLRYDKLGSGETQMASHEKDDAIGYDVFAREVADAYAHMAAQPEIDPSRLLVLGHSEGALFALNAREIIDEHAPQALILAAPPGERYLDTVDRQVTEQVRKAEANGGMDYTEAATALSDLRYAVSLVRDGGDLADADLAPAIERLLTPQTAPFLRTMDAMDPLELAGSVPSDTRVLVLRGTDDSQITRENVDRLMSGLPGAQRAGIEGADHVFRMTGDAPGAAVLDSRRRFSPDVAPAVQGFVQEAVGAS